MSANRVLSRAQVGEARRRHAGGESLRSIARSYQVTHKVVSAALRRPTTSPITTPIGTSTPKAKTSPRGAQREREAVLRTNAKRIESMLAAGDLDPMALVRLSAEARAIAAERAAIKAAEAAAAMGEQVDPAEVVASAERVRGRLARLEVARRRRDAAALVSALAGMPEAVVARALAAVGLAGVTDAAVDDDEHALDLEGTHG